MAQIATCVFIDLETSGIPSRELSRTKITEISMVAVKSEHILETKVGASPRVQQKLTLCLNPRRIVDPGATMATGLCNDLLEHETDFNARVFDLLNTFLELLAKPVCLVAHNGLSFDFPILKKHLDRLNVSFSEDLLCADSFFAFYDILEGKVNKESCQTSHSIQNSTDLSSFSNSDVIDLDIMSKSDCMDMKNKNETTPKQKIIRTTSLSQVRKARRKFPWSEGTKPKFSYKLTNIYEKLLKRPAVDAHRAEGDSILMMECAVVVSKEFVKWISENNKKFSEVKAMEIGVPLGS